MAFVWFAAILVFIMLEVSTVSLVSTWFAVGSLAALIVSLFSGPLWPGKAGRQLLERPKHQRRSNPRRHPGPG